MLRSGDGRSTDDASAHASPARAGVDRSGRGAGGESCSTATRGRKREEDGAVAAGRAEKRKERKKRENGPMSPVRKREKKIE